VLLRLLDALGDGRRDLLGLAVADADGAVTVADDHERGEGEAPAALDDFGDAVDRDDALDVRALLGCCATATIALVATVVAATGSAASALGSWHQMFLISVYVLI
jgi:hypothetical protein